MAKKILITIAFIVTLALIMPVIYAACTYPTGTGDWIVNSNNDCNNSTEYIHLNGSLLVYGTLNLSNVTLMMNSTATTPYNISVYSGGTLYIQNTSNVSAVVVGYGYDVYFRSGSTVTINGTVIEYTSDNSSGGLLMQSNDVTIDNTTITLAKDYAMNISSASPKINRTTLINNNKGIFLSSSSATIENINITDTTNGAGINATNSPINLSDSFINGSNEYGIYLAASNANILNTTIRNSTLDGIFARISIPTISNNTILNNSNSGIFLHNSTATISNNTIKWNNYDGILSNYSNPTINQDNIIQYNALAGINVSLSTSAVVSDNQQVANNSYGLVFHDSNISTYSIYNNNITNHNYGLITQGSSNILVINTMLNNTDYQGINNATNVSTISNLTLLNVTFNNTSIDVSSNMTVKKYIQIYANNSDTGDLIRDATVKFNNTFGNVVITSTTNNTTGYTPLHNLTYYTENSSGEKAYHANYTINVSKGTAWNETFLPANLTTNLTTNALEKDFTVSISDLSTINCSVNGSGNATGLTVQNATLSFAGVSEGTYTTTTNSSGVCNTINLPMDNYTVTVTHTNYTTNTSTVNANATEKPYENFTMLPKIILIGRYVGNTPTSDANYTFISAANNNVTPAAAFTISGNATYAHNNASVGGTVGYSSVPGGVAGSGSSDADNNGQFSIAKTAPSPTSSKNYTMLLWVVDANGSNGSTSDWLYVFKAAVVDDDDTQISGGGGGGASDYGLSITMYDRKLTLAQGESKTTEVEVKNTGVRALEDVSLTIVGIDKAWYNLSVSETGTSTEDLDAAEAVTFKVDWHIPTSATPKAYAGTWRAKDKDSNAITERSMNLTVTEVWQNITISTLKDDIENLKIKVPDLYDEIDKLDRRGINVTSLWQALNEFNETVQSAITSYNSGDYGEANTLMESAKEKLTALQNAISEAKPGFGLPKVSPGKLGVILVVIIIGAIAGFIVWYKMFRVISIAEIKSNPAMFADGARLEGVVKSITDTKKGKVFLIADHTDKLHVRYPYYTTTARGDMIRVSGKIKTYKEVPYMDATDLHRVTVRHKY